MTGSGPPCIGIDVGAPAKGYHLAAAHRDGRVFALSSFPEPRDLVAWLAAVPGHRHAVIAIDGMRDCPLPRSAGTRAAERAMHSLHYSVFWTPRGTDRPVPAWMQHSVRLWQALAGAFPRVRLLETFPSAAADRLLGSRLCVPLGLFHGRERRRHRHDYLDALVAAETAWNVATGTASAYGAGDPHGMIHLPPDRFREHVLCLVREKDRILLGHKKRGFGKGLWNGFGGKVEPGETPETAARRELAEECGLEALGMDAIGSLHFVFADGTEPIRGHVFLVNGHRGVPGESAEMAPRWFAVSRLPYARMWEDDRYWLPHALAGRRFRACFRFDEAGRLAGQAVDVLQDG